MQNKRDLPWRNTTDPYMIWLSEIILQQTRVAQGLPYFLKFTDEFPTVFDLANASETKVMRLWQGLGYYSRARNLHACAKTVVEKYNGTFPTSYRELLGLKGIGKYTAAAIASFAFQEPVPVIDGNVYRVLSRVFGIADDIGSGQGQKEFARLAEELLDRENPHDYNQAIMEFGATHCTPSRPDCHNCIFAHECHANQHDLQHELPVKLKKIKVKTRFFHYLVIQHQGKILLKKRSQSDIWQGLYDFYLVEDQQPLEMDEIASAKQPNWVNSINFKVQNLSRQYKHILTHQRIFARFFHILPTTLFSTDFLEIPDDFQFYSMDEIKDLPKPILINNYLNEHFF